MIADMATVMEAFNRDASYTFLDATDNEAITKSQIKITVHGLNDVAVGLLGQPSQLFIFGT